jgi:hypothetical protein
VPVAAYGPDELDVLSRTVAAWAEHERQTSDIVLAVDHDPAERRWYIRIKGEEKSVTTVWLTVRQRTLHYEAQFMPAPEENAEQLYEYLLRLNTRLFAMRFAIGLEDAVYLVGQLPVTAVDDEELDRIVGSVYTYAEQYFRPAMRIGFASRFKG